ncbi:MAG: 2-amino-4-hydroxy-6-hydroxymethyldihydropteridine diphosphokinase [Candidatus Aureabacteria bacterium]|nr:2-amino-4-hydroxy-6-hydroxymethyldihydropteridine diphosphokinase [Candidatus Auribacterota bacterium]
MGGVLGKRARELKSVPTDAERELWKHLRREQIGGNKFRRQHPIGSYIVDFVCLEKKLVVEVDGSQHRDRVGYDQARTAWLKDKGYEVLRFWDNEVFSNIGGVKQVIWNTSPPRLDPRPSLDPEVSGPNGQGGRRVKEIAYIGLGSNLGDPKKRLREAINLIAAIPGIKIGGISSLYHTEPVGGPLQTWYYNAAVGVETSLAPEELIAALQRIEGEMGRARGGRNAPRTIDLDILLFGERVVQGDRLTIPHPRMCERRFVLAPMAEIAPGIVHPVKGETMGALLNSLSDVHKVVRKGRFYEDR